MKQLGIFFDWDGFATNKEFVCTNVSEYRDYDTKKHLGMKVEAVITKDGTHYEQKNGETVSNLFEKLTFKVLKDVSVPLNARIVPVGVKAKTYVKNGFLSELSIICDDIRIAQPLQKGLGN